VSYMMKCDT